MQKRLPIVFIILLLAGCTATAIDVSPRQSYRPPNSKELWSISGSLSSQFDQLSGAVRQRVLDVYIDDEHVIHGGLSAMATGELSGKYKNHKVNSICASEIKTQNWIEVRCTILIDNERAATLTF